MGCGTDELELVVIVVELECEVAADEAAELDIVAAEVEMGFGVALDVDDDPSANKADEDGVLVGLGALLVEVVDETMAVEDGLEPPAPVSLG